jgi:hypothetical protein
MANLGVFRDSFYNAIHALPAAQATNGPVSTGTLPASQLVGALEVDIAVGNGAAAAQTYTTDTAVNIIARLQNAVAAAQAANVGGFAAALGDTPPLGVPNLFNLSWTVTFSNQGTTAASVLAAGAGVTIAAQNAGMTATAIALGAPNAPVMTRYVVTVTGASTVTFTRVQ